MGSVSKEEFPMKKGNTRTLVGIALLTAVVVVLQLLGSFIRFGTFSVSLVLIPIAVGAALYGWIAGAWLGLAFGITVLLSGDASVFLVVHPLETVLVVLVKGILAGAISGAVYKAFEKRSTFFATIAAAVVCPLVNTGVFLVGCYFFFMDVVQGIANSIGFQGSVYTYLIVGFVGLNFLFELLFNIVLSPTVVRIIKLGKKSA